MKCAFYSTESIITFIDSHARLKKKNIMLSDKRGFMPSASVSVGKKMPS